MNNKIFGVPALVAALAAADYAHGVEFKNDLFEGSFNSTVTVGGGRRSSNPSCSIVGDSAACGGTANPEQWSAGDDGDLNYRKGDWFTLYLKGTHELLLKNSSGLKFFARGTWKKDFKADDTRRTDLSEDAKKQIVNNAELLDLWVSKDFSIGDRNGRVRLGQQVISWGEALYLTGGVATNVLDIQKLLVPGTQLKEAFLPVQALSVSSSLSDTVNLEAYYQFKWRRSRVAPVGSYFSAGDYYDKGRGPVAYLGSNPNVTAPDQYSTPGAPRQMSQDDAVVAIYGAGNYGIPILADKTPKKGGQYGLSLKWAPAGTQSNFGFFAVNYHDQLPVLTNGSMVNGNVNGQLGLPADTPLPALQWRFLENRKMYGLTSSFPLGNWAIGTELTYRPKDAVTLSGCYGAGGALDAATNPAPIDPASCELYKDMKKYQASVTALLQLQKSEHPFVLNLLGADSAFLTIEAALTRYPGIVNGRIRQTINGVEVDQVAQAGYFLGLDRSDPNHPIAARLGTATSWGYVLDFNWTYDGLIPGWQLTPGVTFSHSVKGDTPNIVAQFLEGNKSANLYLMLNQNPTVWQFGINYTSYFGGKKSPVERQVFKDRDFFGFFASYNF